jgi:hypothetical protein
VVRHGGDRQNRGRYQQDASIPSCDVVYDGSLVWRFGEHNQSLR